MLLLLFEDLLRIACSCSVSCGGLDDGGGGGRDGRCGGGKGSVASESVGLFSIVQVMDFFFFSLLCDCLWRVDANLAVPRPLEKWLFGGFKLLNLSCNSFLEEVEQLAGLIGY